ncbi:hypothetical protein [Mycobacterium tilburgii]|uniref:hypothetical protein n=1 Tax=Mycobacterium tilburgii TaxID=44467 RepID=UPI00389916E5
MRCVAEVGYSRATIREIVRTAGMTSGQPVPLFSIFRRSRSCWRRPARRSRRSSRRGCARPPRTTTTPPTGSTPCWTSPFG